MTEIYLHFLFAHYGLYGNAPVGGTVRTAPVSVCVTACMGACFALQDVDTYHTPAPSFGCAATDHAAVALLYREWGNFVSRKPKAWALTDLLLATPDVM